MSWSLPIALIVGLCVAVLVVLARRHELARMAAAVAERERAKRQGADRAQLQHPIIDLARCVGCGACVQVCPEDGVLALVHGQAAVVNGARCVGVAACERACPTAAITVTLGNLAHRDDVPAVAADLEVVGQPGLFLAGEVTAHALIKTAIEHGTKVARAVRARVASTAPALVGGGGAQQPADDTLDLVIVGAGPAGLSCALEATRLGLRFALLDQADTPGGTVAKYPRKKLVLTEPVDLPLLGRLTRDSYSKEDLMALWQQATDDHALPLYPGREVENVARGDDGTFVLDTAHETWRAQHVCLALGRRGTPNKLGVPGEDLPKVAYGLVDAQAYAGRAVLVVGGGDSAVETALALSEQDGTTVTLSYRKDSFFRVRARNEERLHAAIEAGVVRVVFRSEITEITPDAALLRVRDEHGRSKTYRLANDDVFVLIGGKPPLPLLQAAGVSFDPAHHPPVRQPARQGSGWGRALIGGSLAALVTLGFALWHADYYGLPLGTRPTHDKHALLRPGRNLGLALGFAAFAFVAVNLAYLLRRAKRAGFRFGSLRAWMTSHVVTGVLALSCALLHAALAPRDTPGGHAFWALAVLVTTGAIGRYFYAYVPRAANGRELELAEVKQQLERTSSAWDATALGFADAARREIDELLARQQWRGTFAGRVLGVLAGARARRRLLQRLGSAAHAHGMPLPEIKSALALASRAHRAALAAAHFEDLRALLATWRFVHRWVAALLVLLIVVHVVNALRYGQMWDGGGG
jgi:thioredoxin reductase/Pyruvate/2-oxoacid:ferredoxin oxidoreductase delta subunit